MEIEDLTPLAQKLINAITDSEGVQRLPSEESRLVAEKAELPIFFAHFLGELPNHATMLSVALADGYSSLVKLGAKLPFGSNAVARATLELAADLFWIADHSIDSTERARRAVSIYLIQTEATVRQLEQLRKRGDTTRTLARGISEGWDLLEDTGAQAAAQGLWPVRNNRGKIPIIGEGKPPTSQLVDNVVRVFHGQTRVNLYSLLSSTGHGEGSGLGALLDVEDTRTGPTRTYAYNATKDAWSAKFALPCARAATGAVREWLNLALPEQTHLFDANPISPIGDAG